MAHKIIKHPQFEIDYMVNSTVRSVRYARIVTLVLTCHVHFTKREDKINPFNPLTAGAAYIRVLFFY